MKTVSFDSYIVFRLCFVIFCLLSARSTQRITLRQLVSARHLQVIFSILCVRSMPLSVALDGLEVHVEVKRQY